MEELRGKGVDTIVYYYVNCIGHKGWFHPPDSSCEPHQIKYLFWVENHEYLMQQFDECTDHKKAKTTFPFTAFIKRSYNKMRFASMLYPRYYTIIKRKKVYSEVVRDHSCHHMFEIYNGKKKLSEDIDEFALDTKYVEDKYYNLNYNRNQKSILNKLKIATETAIAKYNSSNL